MDSIVTCSRRLEWDSMHRVPKHNGACKAFHGHRYIAEISCCGAISDSGMILDFSVIKEYVGSWINSNWDHTAILQKNDPDPAVKLIQESNSKYGKPIYFMDEPPTAENIVKELARVSKKILARFNINVVKIIVWETPNCSATWTINDKNNPFLFK